MESKMDENDHVRCVGAIVTNLQALETALRFFLGRRYDQYLEFPKPGDTTARKSYLTAFAPLAWISTARKEPNILALLTRRRARPFHHGTATDLSMRPEARTMGRCARRWKRTVISRSVMATSAGMSMRSRKIWRA